MLDELRPADTVMGLSSRAWKSEAEIAVLWVSFYILDVSGRHDLSLLGRRRFVGD